MKKKKYTSMIKSVAVILSATALLMACSKDYSDNPAESQTPDQGSKKITNKAEQQRIDAGIARLPGLAIYNEPRDSYILLDLNNAKNGFNFASADAAVSFSSPDGSVTFVQAPDGSFYQVVTPGSGTGGSGGGVVTAGNLSLSMDYVFCFSSGDDFFGTGLFDVDDGFDGFSGAVGISGNFEALENGEVDDDADPFDFFNGFAAFYAFDGTAEGNYDVIDFFSAETETDISLQGKGIAFLLSFVGDGGIFFSSDGEVSFSGGSVSFNGTYLGLTDFLLSFDEDIDDESPQYEEVPGSGTIFCN